MKIKQSMKILLAFLVCVCIAATLLFSSWFIITHTDHDCTGHDCRVCLQLHLCSDALQKFGTVLCILTSSAWIITAGLGLIPLAVKYFPAIKYTPVELKVRMNN